MAAVRKLVLAGVAVVVFASACTTITIPTMPPIPTIPPGFTMPPISIPSFSLPAIPPVGTATCSLVSAAEVNTTLGGTYTDQSSSPTQCSFLPSGGLPLVVTVQDGPIIDGIKFVAQGEDLNIGGSRALFASFFLGDGVYVEKGGRSLTVQAFAQTNVRDQLIALANLAVTRF